MRSDFKGKVALVTGAASGIGRVSARRLAEEDAAVVVADRDGVGVARTAEMIRQGGGQAVPVTADRKLRVNALCPGYTYTKMTGFEQNDSLAEELAMPAYRGGVSAQHMAEVAPFLLSQRANGINGHAQLVDAAALASLTPLEDLSLPGDRQSGKDKTI